MNGYVGKAKFVDDRVNNFGIIQDVVSGESLHMNLSDISKNSTYTRETLPNNHTSYLAYHTRRSEHGKMRRAYDVCRFNELSFDEMRNVFKKSSKPKGGTLCVYVIV